MERNIKKLTRHLLVRLHPAAGIFKQQEGECSVFMSHREIEWFHVEGVGDRSSSSHWVATNTNWFSPRRSFSGTVLPGFEMNTNTNYMQDTLTHSRGITGAANNINMALLSSGVTVRRDTCTVSGP